jgi:unsaturated rhamnogalacturonyl hydrolase
MKNLLLVPLFCLICVEILAQNQAKTLKKLRLANAYFMEKWADTGKPIVSPDRTRPSNIWTRAVYYEGLMALNEIDPQQKYLDYAIAWGENHRWNLRNAPKTRNGDDQACGQTYIDLYKIDPQPTRILGIKANIDTMLASSKIDDWWWIDALQMSMPVFARLGVMQNDNRYFERMYEMYNFTKTKHGGNGLFNPEEGLWWRDKDFVPPYKEPNGKNCYWSRGNGWVLMAMVRVLDIMPENAPHRQEYLDMFLQMCEALAKVQRTDGYWNVSLHDPENFGGQELTGSSMFVYGMAWGIRKGILDKEKYLPIVQKSWKAQLKAVHKNGFLGYVQGTGKEPKDGQPVTFDSMPNFEDFGLGAFLLAGTEMMKL